MKERGLTLLEVLVATAILGIAVVGLLSSLSSSMNNAARLSDYDRSVLLARSKMDELIALKRAPRLIPLEGAFDANTGWRARIMPFDAPPGAAPGTEALDRIEVEIWWMQGSRRRTFTLEGFRRTRLTPEDVASGALPR